MKNPSNSSVLIAVLARDATAQSLSASAKEPEVLLTINRTQ